MDKVTESGIPHLVNLAQGGIQRADLALPSGFNDSPDFFYDVQEGEESAEEGFIKNLPVGDPDKYRRVGEKDIEGIREQSMKNPLRYFQELYKLSPEDRLRVVKGTDLNVLALVISDLGVTQYQDRMVTDRDSVAQFEQATEEAYKDQYTLAQAVVAALGEANVRLLALNLTNPRSFGRTTGREHQRAAIILAQGLALRDVPAIFAHYGNLARSKTENISNPWEWLIFFNNGMRTLVCCVERDLKKHPATLKDVQSRNERYRKERPYDFSFSGFKPPQEVEARIRILNGVIKSDLEVFLRRHNKNAVNNPMVKEVLRSGKISVDFDSIYKIREHLPDMVEPEGRGYMQPNALDSAISLYLRLNWDSETGEYAY